MQSRGQPELCKGLQASLLLGIQAAHFPELFKEIPFIDRPIVHVHLLREGTIASQFGLSIRADSLKVKKGPTGDYFVLAGILQASECKMHKYNGEPQPEAPFIISYLALFGPFDIRDPRPT